MVTFAMAQVAGGTMSFDGADDIQLDSIYPAGCWQVGHPNKPVFTSAYDEPNALVTDTLLPHMDSTTCYAQFTLVANEDFVLGKRLRFKYWSDMDSLHSLGWVEQQGSFSGNWHNVQNGGDYWVHFESSGELQTDSGAFFTGRTGGWHDADIWIECMGVFWDPNSDRAGGWSDTMRLRFAFRGAANVDQWDGWMIDRVTVEPLPCSGSVAEHDQAELSIAPNPADQWVRIDADGMDTGAWGHQLISMDGRIRREKVRGVRGLDVSDLPNGLYLLRSEGNGRSISTRLIIQH